MSDGPIDNTVFVMILQHPREKKEALATAALTRRVLARAELVIGLSWPNLGRILGRPVDAQRWAVLYLGSARPAGFDFEHEIVAVDRRGEPTADQNAMRRGLEGVVLLDGSWSEAKTLWWRSPWLLKLHRIVLNPQHKSRFGGIRREPRREALSTLEAAALLLKHLDPRGPEIEAALLGALDRLIDDVRPARRQSRRRFSTDPLGQASEPALGASAPANAARRSDARSAGSSRDKMASR
jgi:DTW domain-containing protein